MSTKLTRRQRRLYKMLDAQLASSAQAEDVKDYIQELHDENARLTSVITVLQDTHTVEMAREQSDVRRLTNALETILNIDGQFQDDPFDDARALALIDLTAREALGDDRLA